MNNCLSGTMSLGANLLSIFVPSYFLTVTKRNKSFFNSNLYIIFHLDCCYKYYSITLFFQLFAFSVSRYICFG